MKLRLRLLGSCREWRCLPGSELENSVFLGEGRHVKTPEIICSYLAALKYSNINNTY